MRRLSLLLMASMAGTSAPHDSLSDEQQRHAVESGAKQGMDNRDTRYFPYANPNLSQYSMYYADARNVLQDLSQFRRLYVTYHNCAWSYRASYSSGGGRQHFCGAEDETSWYTGMDECMGANAAYSLYGAHKGNHHSGCFPTTYINSFVTTNGLDVFAPGIDTSLVTNACLAFEANSTSSASDDDDGHLGDDLHSQNGYSVTTGCSADGTFTTDMYAGQDCQGAKYIRTLKKRTQLNSNLAQVKCKLIYDDSAGLDYATLLLQFSEACTLGELGPNCPDPYGLVAKYERNLGTASRKYRSRTVYEAYSSPVVAKMAFGSVLAMATLFLMVAKFRRRSIKWSCVETSPSESNQESKQGGIRSATEAKIDQFNSAMEAPAAAVRRSLSNAAQQISRTVSMRRSGTAPIAQFQTTPVNPEKLSRDWNMAMVQTT